MFVRLLKKSLALCLIPLLVACTSIPNGITPVTNFEVERYLGTWYEIARLDHRFERGLQNVTAEYSLEKNGNIRVLNTGTNSETGVVDTAEGKARFVKDSNTGHLEVSFFGPFYSSYVIFELDQEDYRYAFVSGYNKKYLWLLARTPVIEQSVIDSFTSLARESGFPVEELIFVEQ